MTARWATETLEGFLLAGSGTGEPESKGFVTSVRQPSAGITAALRQRRFERELERKTPQTGEETQIAGQNVERVSAISE